MYLRCTPSMLQREQESFARWSWSPAFPKKIDLVADAHETLVGLEDMAVMRLYDVDGRQSAVSGAGLVSCVRGVGAVNEVLKDI